MKRTYKCINSILFLVQKCILSPFSQKSQTHKVAQVRYLTNSFGLFSKHHVVKFGADTPSLCQTAMLGRNSAAALSAKTARSQQVN